MKKIIILAYILFSPIIASAQLKFGLIGGVKDFNANTYISGRYEGVDIMLRDNNVDYIQLGMFMELEHKKWDFLRLRLNGKSHRNNFFVVPIDYDPPGNTFVVPSRGTYVSSYQAFLLDIIPSVVIKRNIQYRIGVGYQLTYMHHRNPDGPTKDYITERWWSQPKNRKSFDFANEIITQNPLKKFNHSIVFNVEARYWHIGLGLEYAASVASIAKPVDFKGEFVYPFVMDTRNISVNLNIYWDKIKY